jgi:hypothetical protein
VNYISGIQTSGSPLVTTFTNQNADPENGTPWQPTAGVFGENIIFANSIGVMLGYGGRFVKISDNLDGFYSKGQNGTGNFTPSAAKATIFGIKVWMLLWNVVYPIFATNENKLLMTDGKRWWTSSQGINLIYIAGQEINSNLIAYGTDGNAIYPLFQNPSTNFFKSVLSKYWDEPGGYLMTKTIDRVWGSIQWNDTIAPADVTVSVDTDANFPSASVSFAPTIVGGLTVLPPTTISTWGTLIGITLQTYAADVQIVNITLGIADYAYKG